MLQATSREGGRYQTSSIRYDTDTICSRFKDIDTYNFLNGYVIFKNKKIIFRKKKKFKKAAGIAAV